MIPPSRQPRSIDQAGVATAPEARIPVSAAPTTEWGDAARLEAVSWITIAVVAVALRLINLDGNPLQAAEATLAMDSWRILQGQGIVIGPSPLLIYANVILFFALGATDAVARAVPMLVGSAVALSPFFLRGTLGRVGALAAALILATSPSLIYASRSVDGAMLAVGAALALVLLLARYLMARRPRDLALAGGTAALMLLSGPAAYVILIPFLGFAAACAWEWGDQQRPKAAEVAADPAGWLSRSASLDSLLRSGPDRRRFAIAFGGVFVIVATGLGSYVPGFGIALAMPLGLWAAGFGAFGSVPLTLFPSILIAYEPLALAAGLGGALLTFRSGRLFSSFLVWWAAVGLVCLILSGGRTPHWIASVIVPLALLGGYAFDRLPPLLRAPERRRALLVGGPLLLSLAVTTLIALSNVTLTVPNVPVWTVALPPLAMICLVGFFVGWENGRSAAAVVIAAAVIGLLILQIHAALLLNPGRPLNPGELFVGTATSPDVQALARQVALIQDEFIIAQKNEGRPVTSDIQILSPYADLVAWYLHDRPGVRPVTTIDGAPAIAVVGAADPAPRGAYAGQIFQLATATGPRAATLGELGRWWLYHQGPTIETTSVKVFVKKWP